MRQASFIEEAYIALEGKQTRLKDDFGVANYERWDCDQRHGTILFSNEGTTALRADVQFVGSVSLPRDRDGTGVTGGTWLWSWANDSLLRPMWEEILRVRSFGNKNGFAKLTIPKWPAEEVDGWEMAAVATKILDAQGVYRMPSERNHLFAVLHNLSRVD